MTTAYDVASRVLTAAADGETVPGFEAVGELLIDLRTTTPVPPGTALGSSAVSVASAATTSRFAPMAMPAWVRPEVIVLSLAALVMAGLFVFGLPRASTTEIGPGSDTGPADGAARVVSSAGAVDEEGSGNDGGGEESTTSLDAQPSTTAATGPSPAAGSVGPPAPETTASAGPATTTAPSAEASTTSAAPSPTSTVDPTSTTTPAGGEVPDPEGNNGNGNGKGVGNGKGNQGQADGDQGRPDDPRG